jgi:hypothetical protein
MRTRIQVIKLTRSQICYTGNKIFADRNSRFPAQKNKPNFLKKLACICDSANKKNDYAERSVPAVRSRSVLDTLLRVEVAEGVEHVNGRRDRRLERDVVAAGAGAGMAGVGVTVAVALDADGTVGIFAIAVVSGGAQLARRACNSIESTIVTSLQ